jgi:hypothetical protein
LWGTIENYARDRATSKRAWALAFQTIKKRFKTQDIALISIFSALWIALNLAVAPLSFALTGLSAIHDFSFRKLDL